MKTFTQIGTEIGELVEKKNAAYGSSFAVAGDFLRLLFPGGVPVDRFDDALLMVRIFDKQMRIAIRRIQREMDRLGWDQARLDAFLASPRGPNGRSTAIRTLGEANRVYWALKHIPTQKEQRHAS